MTNYLFDSLFGVHAGKQSSFISNPLTGETVSYDAFLASAARCANALSASHIKKGDRIVAQVNKSVSALSLYAACVQAGVVYLPLNTAYTSNEVEYFLKDSGAKLLVCDPDNEQSLSGMVNKHNANLLTLSADGSEGSLIDLSNTLANHFETVPCEPNDLAAFLYTSGTTGRSKGAMLTQDNLLSNAETLVKLWKFTDKDVLLHALPIFHTHGLFVATNVCLLAGSTIIFEAGFDKDRIIDLLPHATSMMGVPTFYTRLLADERLNNTLTKNMRLFISGSAPLLADTHKEFTQRTGHHILERYGMTETNMTTSNPYDGERRAGTVGFALPGVEVKITDPATGNTLAADEIGQLEVRGPNVFKGYWNMPEKTAEELRADGFFITGDLCQMDSDGYISIVGRDKDLIISGGYNIYPKEIELVLDDLPDVVESAVVGVPHPDFGESVVAVLVPQSMDIANDAAKKDQLIQAAEKAVADSLARFKHPRHFALVERLPRNAMGKIQKNSLREEFAKLFS